MSSRYAIYLTLPADSTLYQLAATWLGHDIYRDQSRPYRPIPARLKQLRDQHNLTLVARGYGFHATLKPPFTLHAERELEELLDAFDRYVLGLTAFKCKPLTLIQLGHFLVLMPCEDCRTLNELAAISVKTFEPFRAPLTVEEYQSRKPESLTERQRLMLNEWGYPYVMDEFRFHMTLTDTLSQDMIQTCRPLLQDYLSEGTSMDFEINQISLLKQQDQHTPFYEIKTEKLK